MQLSPETKDFIRSLLEPNLDERLTAQEALTHPFIGYSEENVSEISRVSKASLNSCLSESVKQARAVVRATGNYTKPMTSEHRKSPHTARLPSSSTKITAEARSALATHGSSPKSSKGQRSNGYSPSTGSKERVVKPTLPENGLGAKVGSWEGQVSPKDSSTGYSRNLPANLPETLPESGLGTEVRSLGLGTEVGGCGRRISSKGSAGPSQTAPRASTFPHPTPPVQKEMGGFRRRISSGPDGSSHKAARDSSMGHSTFPEPTTPVQREVGGRGRWFSKGSDSSSHTAARDASAGHPALLEPTSPVQRATSPENGLGTEVRSWGLGTDVSGWSRWASKGSDVSSHTAKKDSSKLPEPVSSRSFGCSSLDCQKAASFHGRSQPPPTPHRSSSFEHDGTLPARKPRNLTPLDMTPLLPGG